MINSGPLSSAKINALGDSLSMYSSSFFPPSTPSTAAPQWLASTAYAVNNVVYNGGYFYRCTAAGTSASSGGPSGVTGSITDGGVTWAYLGFVAQKSGNSYLQMVEFFSLNSIVWDMDQGYSGTLNGLLKANIISGGNSYAGGDTVTFNNGAKGTLTVVGGVITGVTITNPGYGPSGFTYTINTSTGSGAVLSLIWVPSGTFAVTGCFTQDMVARLTDVTSSSADIICVEGGTNDIVINGTSAATVKANLQQCYEQIMAAGKKVIAITITPRTSLTLAQLQAITSVNQWIRDYCNKVPYANPNGYVNIACADPSGYWQDGTNSGFYPIGGSAAASGAMTLEGLHPSQRGVFYYGYCVWQAAQNFMRVSPAYPVRNYAYGNGYDFVNNISGNLLEGCAWQASTGYVVGQQVSNNSNVYVCSQTGTSASSGGPTTTGSGITDGGAKWNYLRAAGSSVAMNGTGGTTNAAAGITFSGSYAANYYIGRNSGSATGTMVGSIENPWSNGQTGKRQTIAVSIGSGTTTEQFYYVLATGAYANMGIVAADLGVNKYYGMVELELSAVANCTGLYLQLFDNSTFGFYQTSGFGLSGAGNRLLNSSGEPISYPNNGKLIIRTQPTVLPLNLVNLQLCLFSNHDASGAANSSTLTFKVNYIGIHRYGAS